MIVAMACLKTRDAADEAEIDRIFDRMQKIVTTIPGFLSYKRYQADDGEEIEVVRFDSEQALELWRTHPEHLEAQRRGREEFFEEYWVEVSSVIRRYHFKRGIGYVDDLP